jgi:hypothetical protein
LPKFMREQYQFAEFLPLGREEVVDLGLNSVPL